MGCRSTVLTDMEDAGFTTCAQHVFFILREQVECSDDGRTPAASRWLAQRTGRSEKAVRHALRSLSAAGWIKITQRKRREPALAYILIHRLRGATKDATKDATKLSSIQPELIVMGATKDATKDATGVSRSLDVSLPVGVAVSSPVSKEVVKIPPQKIAAAQGSQNQEKLPGWNRLRDHITKTWTEKKRGLKPDWPKEAWINLARQARRFQCQEIAALWDEYLVSTDTFIVSQGYPLTWFCCRSIDGLADSPSYKQRGAAYLAWWENRGPQPKAAQRAIQEKSAIFKPIPQSVVVKPRSVEPIDIPESPEQLRAMHLQRVAKIGCRKPNCEYCVAPKKELAVAGTSPDAKIPF